MDEKRLLQDRAHTVSCIQRLRGILENHLHLATKWADFGLAGLGDVFALEGNTARVGLVESDDGLAEC